MRNFLVATGITMFTILSALSIATTDETKLPTAAPESRLFPMQQSVEIYGQLVEISRSDLAQLIQRPLADDPRGKSQVLSAVIKDNLRATFLEWSKTKRAVIKDISTDIISDRQRARLCFVETSAMSGYADVVTKRYFNVRCSLNHDDTFQVGVSPGLLTIVPPLLDGRVMSQATTFGAELKGNEALVWGNFGDSQTPRVSLYFFSVRLVKRHPFASE